MNKILFGILLLLLMINGYNSSAQTVYERDQLFTTTEGKVTILLLKEDKSPLSGNAKIIENNRKYTIASYRKGMVDGYYQEFGNGKVIRQGFYRLGRKDGKWEEFFPDGAICKRSFYANGELQGEVTTYFSDGGIESVRTYIQGKKEGIERVYFPNRKERFVKHYHNDKLHGAFFELSEGYNGTTIQTRRNYLNGKIHGKEITEVFDISGKRLHLIEISYEDGKETGRKQTSF